MTKEEYDSLLKTDYWKGYSYSLIKERGFRCQDCGRVFYNQRHKLQVHHLVYRNTYPWSYNPEEMVVLCEECHKRRHGIRTWTNDSTIDSDTDTQNYEDCDYYSYIGERKRKINPFWLVFILVALALILTPIIYKSVHDRNSIKNNFAEDYFSVINHAEKQAEELRQASQADIKKVKKKKNRKKTTQEDIQQAKENVSKMEIETNSEEAVAEPITKNTQDEIINIEPITISHSGENP